MQRIIDDMVALLGGERRDLNYVNLDTGGLSDLQRRVYATARTIPAGATLTYGEIAERLGDRALARDVGEALGQNPFPIIVPCHRRAWRPTGNPAGFRRPAASAPSFVFFPSRARSRAARRCSTIFR